MQPLSASLLFRRGRAITSVADDSRIACAIIVMKGEVITYASKRPNEPASERCLAAPLRFSEERKHDEARTYDATPGRVGAAQGTAGADVFGRAIAIVRHRILQQGTG